MRTAFLTLAGLAGIGLLTWICSTQHKAMIEEDLGNQTRQSLSAASLNVAQVEADGQIITLRGTVADEAAKLKAGDLAANVFGVSEVRNLLEVQPVAKASLPAMTPEEHKAAIDCQAQFNDLLKEPIRFATGSTAIHPESYALLDKLSSAARICPAASIEIGGHTDSSGSVEMNMKLSEARANQVKRYLERKGIIASRLSAVGYGPTKPVGDNGTPEGMSKNRRTEFVVKGI